MRTKDKCNDSMSGLEQRPSHHLDSERILDPSPRHSSPPCVSLPCSSCLLPSCHVYKEILIHSHNEATAYPSLGLLTSLAGTFGLVQSLKGRRSLALSSESLISLSPLLLTIAYTLLTGLLARSHVSPTGILQLMVFHSVLI